jgi:hypothetical protein
MANVKFGLEIAGALLIGIFVLFAVYVKWSESALKKRR